MGRVSGLLGGIKTCLQCFCKLVLTDVRDCFCFASFFYLKQKSESDVIALYMPSYQPAHNTLGPSNLWI